MNEQLNINGPVIAEEQLIDIYRTTQDQPSPWVMISDQVMGGVSAQSGVKSSAITRTAAV